MPQKTNFWQLAIFTVCFLHVEQTQHLLTKTNKNKGEIKVISIYPLKTAQIFQFNDIFDFENILK